MRLVRGVSLAGGLSACTLLTKLDDLSGGTAPATTDGMAPIDASIDAKGTLTDALADGGASCGFPGLTQGLLAYYPFDEGSANVVHDCSGNHHDGTFVRLAADTWQPGKKGGAIRVTASTRSGCVDLGMPPALQTPALTIAVWANVATFPGSPASGYFMGQTLNADTDGWRFGTQAGDGGAPVFSWQHKAGGTKYVVQAPAPPLGGWHHAAVTFAADGRIEVFVDGKSAALMTGVLPIVFAAQSLRIGCRSDNANPFDGLLDEVRVYDRVLTPAEIAVLAAD